MAESPQCARTRSGSAFNALLGEFLGKPFRSGASGPDAYDCYGLARAFLARLGMGLPDLGATSVENAAALTQQAHPHFVPVNWARPWSLVSFRKGGELATHCGVVLPGDGLFLHAQEKSGVVAEPLTHRYWHPRIEGYYWPRGIVEMVIMHSPIGLEHSWAFYREGLTLEQMLPVTAEEKSQIRVFIDAQEVPPQAWGTTIPTALQQVLVRPVYGDGRQVIMAIGMVVLAIVAPYAIPALGPAFAAGTPAYYAAMAGVMIGGGMLLNALVPPHQPDRGPLETSYGWNPQTMQREGLPIARLYGEVPVYGNIVMAFGDASNVTATYTTYEDKVYTNNFGYIFKISTEVSHPYLALSAQRWNTKIGYGDGPIQGVVAGSEKINGQPTTAYAGLTVEHKNGTDSQAATTLGDRIEYSLMRSIGSLASETYTFPDKDVDKLAVSVGFPNGLVMYTKQGDATYFPVGVKVEIRPVGGVWSTLVNTVIQGRSTTWLHEVYVSDQTYPNGAPVTITRGTQYEVRVTRTSEEKVGDRYRNSLYLEAVQGIYTDGFKYPGMAYTAITALAGAKLSGALEFRATVQGRIVPVYNGTSWVLQYSNNPAWIMVDLYTRPVIRGDGSGTPYTVEYFRGIDVKWIDADAFKALADYCDESVDDGKGGTEKRFTFNGILEEEQEAWQVALRVASMCRAWPYFNGRQITVAIDKAATPVQAFTVSNILKGNFDEAWFEQEGRISQIDYTIIDADQDYRRVPITIVDENVTPRAPVSVDGWGITSQAQVYRTGIHALTTNRLMPRSVEFLADLDAIYCKIGDVVYVQHNNLDTNQGGRVTAVVGNKITVNFTPADDGVSTYKVLVRTVDSTNGEKLTLYTVSAVSGSDITITLPDWTYIPAANDVVMYGTSTEINDLYRIRTMSRTQDSQVRIFATAYDEDYYGPDALAPIIATEQSVAAAQADRNRWSRPPSWDELNNAFPQTAIAVTPDAQVPRLSSMSWTGNGTTTVSWNGSDLENYGTILYQGVLFWIAPNVPGTTDKYIYFDPNIADPSQLQTTNDLSTLQGQERFVFCVNVGGVAYPQPGVRLGYNATLIGVEEGADVTADHPIDSFRETFDDPNGDVVVRWPSYVGGGSYSIQTGGLAGGKVLRAGDNSGDDMVWLIYYRSIPFDPSKLYRMRIRVRQTAGSAIVEAGVAGRDATDTQWVNSTGSNSPTSQHTLCAHNVSPGGSWVEYTGYFRGSAASGSKTGHPDPASPGVLQTNVRYFRPLIGLNYPNSPGTMEIDEVSVDVVPENADQIAESGTRKWAGESGADVTGSHTAANITGQGALATMNQVDTAQVVARAITRVMSVTDFGNYTLFHSPPGGTYGQGKVCVCVSTAQFTATGQPFLVTLNGSLYVNYGTTVYLQNDCAIYRRTTTGVALSGVTLSGTSNVVIATATPHGISVVGSLVYINGAVLGTTQLQNGIFIVAAIPDGTHLQLDETNSDHFSAYTSGGLLYPVVAAGDNWRQSALDYNVNNSWTQFHAEFIDDAPSDGVSYVYMGGVRNYDSAVDGILDVASLNAVEFKR